MSHWTFRWPAKKQKSWPGRMGCATWRRRPVTPSTWSMPSPSWPETSSPWCVLVTSPSRRVGRAWKAGLSLMWFTLPRKWRRVTVAVYADLGKGIATEGAKEMDPGVWWGQGLRGEWPTSWGINPKTELKLLVTFWGLIVEISTKSLTESREGPSTWVCSKGLGPLLLFSWRGKIPKTDVLVWAPTTEFKVSFGSGFRVS